MNNNCCFYDLLDIKEFDSILSDKYLTNEHIIVTDYITKSLKKYKLVRYNKDVLTADSIDTVGLLKSVVINSDAKVIGFSPPKCISIDKFMNNYPLLNDNIMIEEMIEGTMVNLFWDSTIGIDGGWEISTRNEIGTHSVFDKDNDISIDNLFLDTCLQNQIDIHFLNKEYSYSFVLQHPSLKTVTLFTECKIFLVEIYKIYHYPNNILIFPISLDIVKNNYLFNFNINSNLLYPKVFPNKKSYADIIQSYSSYNHPYHQMGIIIRNKKNGERCKVLNPNYLYIKNWNIDYSKLLFRYLYLRKQKKIKEYLDLYPRHNNIFIKFREIIHKFTEQLFENYILLHVKKIINIKDILPIYQPHLCNLHNKYIKELVNKKLCINKQIVIQYVNNLHPSKQLFVFNYSFRNQYIDSITL
jgi:hypothetical protein